MFLNKFADKKLIIGGAVAVLVIGALFFLGGESDIEYDTVTVKRELLVQEISVTGRVEAVESVDLAFENSGKVGKIYVEVGDIVTAGQILITLENLEEMAQVAQARAILSKDQAVLNELKKGVRVEEIALQKAKVLSAITSEGETKKVLLNAIQNAVTQSDDAIRNRADQFFTNPTSGAPRLNIAQFGEDNLEKDRVTIGDILYIWARDVSKLSFDEDLVTPANQSKDNLNLIKDFLDRLASIVNRESTEVQKTSLFTGRSNVNNSLTLLIGAEEDLKDAKSAHVLAEGELLIKTAGTIEEQIIAQDAKIREAEANIQYYNAQLTKTILRSPIGGVVTVQDAKVGAIVSANTLLSSVISEGEYQIEAFVVEADIANLEVGDVATLVLDAYGEDVVFVATVSKIDPAAKLIEGVANYRTILQLKEKDERIRAGMTADIDIVTAERSGVVVIPQRAVVFKDGLKLVRVLKEDGGIEEVNVETGITGNRGLIEIVSGIEEGDVVVTAIKS